MTISSTTRVAGPYTGSGSTATFPFAFKVFLQSDLYVVTLDLATGALAVLALTTDYSVTLNEDQDSSPGGSITLTAGDLASGLTLTITTAIAMLQGLDLTNAGGFYPDVINNALDLLTVYGQQLGVTVSLALQFPVTDVGATVVLPPAAERAGKLLMFDDDGNVTLMPIAPGSGVPGGQQCGGTVDGSNATFTFTAAAGVTPVPVVFAAGIFQTPGGDYGTPTFVSGTTWQLVFTAAPTQGPVTVLLFA